MSVSVEAAEEQKALGNAEFNAKNFVQAIEHYSEAIRLDPGNYIYYSNRSAAYGACNRWSEAEADAEECLKRNSAFAKGYHRLANAQKQLGKHDEAVATLRAAQSKASGAHKLPGMKKLMNEPDPISTIDASTPGNRVLTPAIAKELNELQPQLVDVQRELEQINSRLTAYEHQKKRLALVTKEISELPEDTVTYQGIGKMFLQTSPAISTQYTKKEQSELDKKISSLQAQHSYLGRQKKNLEANISELLAQCSQTA